MNSPLRVLISNTFNPWFNLATENHIFRDMDPQTKILFLWRNQETVVIGRFQNPWTECNLEAMEKDEVKLARRQSGGGAVFHDLGNTNFTFLNGKKEHSKEINNKIITNAISEFGVNAFASGRNDLCVNHPDDNLARKISGSAFKETPERAFHHGTLLIDADMSKLGNYLNPSKKKLESKGIKSVRSRVANLVEFNKEITHENLSLSIIKNFFDHYQNECEIEHLDQDILIKNDKLSGYYNDLKNWKWRFGETPKFNHFMEERFDWGGIEIHIDAHKGLITDTQIFSDSLHPEMIEYLMHAFKGKVYDEAGISTAIAETALELPMIEDYLTELKDWITKEIK